MLNRAFLPSPSQLCTWRVFAVDFSTRVTSTMGATEQMNISRTSNRDSMHNKGTLSSARQSKDDRRVAVYDNCGSVNLSAGMQTTVPKPFKPLNSEKPSHHNSAGSGSTSAKLLSNSIKQTHQSRNFATFSPNGNLSYIACSNHVILTASPGRISQVDDVRWMSSSSEGEVKVSQKDRLKKAVKEYGATVVIFHVSISLVSLGCFYLAVSSGLDVEKLLSFLGFSKDFLASSLATGASTFAIAYAVHKVFAPARIAITLTAAPLIVRHLRKIGFLAKRVDK